MQWIEPQVVHSSEKIVNAYPGSILLPEQLSKRGLTTLAQARAFLDPDSYSQHSPFYFPDMQKAIQRIQLAIQRRETIGIWGDFDVDGQTSTALLVDGLRRAGAQVIFRVPNRARESHGIQLDFLKEFMRNKLGLLITCDTGISALDALQFASQQGLDVILSDHHTPPSDLPPAFAILNPKLLPSTHAFYPLAGVGTAFQILRALSEQIANPNICAEYQDLVALGTIADLADLTGENRFYAQKGLRLMNQRLRPALSAILEMADVHAGTITESLIGFTIAPRLNAAGRLDDANRNVDLLLAKDQDEIAEIVKRLEELNSERKLAVAEVYKSALDMLRSEPELARSEVILLASPNWEQGVVGIAASRLVEQFYKPVILMKIENGIAAGSARSIEGVNLIDAIAQHADLLLNFGGHPMAAGLVLPADRLPEFRFLLSRSVRQQAVLPVEKQLVIDSYLPLSSLNPSLASEIQSLAPFGNGNPAPVLVTQNLEMTESVPLGREDLHRKVIIRDQEGQTRSVLWWNARDQPQPPQVFDLAYTLHMNDYKGRSELILEWVDWREPPQTTQEIRQLVFTDEVEDLRLRADAVQFVSSRFDESRFCVWGEALRNAINLPVRTRLQLEQKPVLVILTPPPSHAILHNALQIVHPKWVILCNASQPVQDLKTFLKNLSGLMQYALHHTQAQIDVPSLSASLSLTDDVIEKGLLWWQAHGEIYLEKKEPLASTYEIHRSHASRPFDESRLNELTDWLKKALEEIRAFSSFYLRAKPEALLRKTSSE